MARQITDATGTVWTVTLSGRHTQYAKDEVALTMTAAGEQRQVRFSPRGAKAPERAIEEASDALLLRLLNQAQPVWTSPVANYGRSG
ncbi:MAG: hypothetical protein U0974_09160 [Gemmatimonadales bacterium]|nr:hypothetical protein [Gemmatimonadales bacterium]MDZ4389885.1 hypothetical protein [Gemmatimonadales bacterium]